MGRAHWLPEADNSATSGRAFRRQRLDPCSGILALPSLPDSTSACHVAATLVFSSSATSAGSLVRGCGPGSSRAARSASSEESAQSALSSAELLCSALSAPRSLLRALCSRALCSALSAPRSLLRALCSALSAEFPPPAPHTPRGTSSPVPRRLRRLCRSSTLPRLACSAPALQRTQGNRLSPSLQPARAPGRPTETHARAHASLRAVAAGQWREGELEGGSASRARMSQRLRPSRTRPSRRPCLVALAGAS